MIEIKELKYKKQLFSNTPVKAPEVSKRTINSYGYIYDSVNRYVYHKSIGACWSANAISQGVYVLSYSKDVLPKGKEAVKDYLRYVQFAFDEFHSELNDRIKISYRELKNSFHVRFEMNLKNKKDSLRVLTWVRVLLQNQRCYAFIRGFRIKFPELSSSLSGQNLNQEFENRDVLRRIVLASRMFEGNGNKSFSPINSIPLSLMNFKNRDSISQSIAARNDNTSQELIKKIIGKYKGIKISPAGVSNLNAVFIFNNDFPLHQKVYASCSIKNKDAFLENLCWENIDQHVKNLICRDEPRSISIKIGFKKRISGKMITRSHNNVKFTKNLYQSIIDNDINKVFESMVSVKNISAENLQTYRYNYGYGELQCSASICFEGYNINLSSIDSSTVMKYIESSVKKEKQDSQKK